MDQSGALKWRDVVEKHQAAMLDELSIQFHSDLQNAVSEALSTEKAQLKRQIARACDDARRSHAELLNQDLRRQRLATTQEQALQYLLECGAPFADKSVVLVFENNQAHLVGAKGLDETIGTLISTSISTTEARAVLSAIESRDPLVAVASPDELSAPVAAAFQSRETDSESIEYPKAYLFPLVSRQSVVAVLIASGSVEQAPLELLCSAAAMRIEALTPETLRRSDEASGRSEKVASSWKDLSAEEQKIHLQAQRMARVRVAEIRLAQEDALHDGVAAKDIYGALRIPIDNARQQFLQTYLSKSPTMVDYMHLEILRTLAGDNDKLLGASYPGPMV